MKTKILESNEENIHIAAGIIRQGGLVAFPTETVYGLGADALNPDAVGKVYAAKGRPSDNPMIVHIAKPEDFEKLTPSLSPVVRKLMEAFWPGPLTMVVRRKPEVPDVTTGGLDTVGVRMPDNKTALALIEYSGTPIAAPSANISGRPSPTRPGHVIHDLDGRIDAILTGGDCRVGIESTVLDVTTDEPVILRPGIITKKELEKALGLPVSIDPALLQKRPAEKGKGLGGDDPEFHPKAPGMKYRHYAPKAEMVIVRGRRDAVEKEVERLRGENEKAGRKVGVILFGEQAFAEAAHDFFADLRAMDECGTDLIIAGALSDTDGVGFAVMNRMLKSAGYNIIEV
ncbi:MAG: threonylcarbamoyl-AMP synthase [Clostridia bacterium]|nr:threonylcarbamoyl-AMP synthase [Clostridia bacterium]